MRSHEDLDYFNDCGHFLKVGQKEIESEETKGLHNKLERGRIKIIIESVTDDGGGLEAGVSLVLFGLKLLS